MLEFEIYHAIVPSEFSNLVTNSSFFVSPFLFSLSKK